MPIVKIVQAISITIQEGKGTEEDPLRDVQYLYDMNGNQLSRNDVLDGKTLKPLSDVKPKEPLPNQPYEPRVL